MSRKIRVLVGVAVLAFVSSSVATWAFSIGAAKWSSSVVTFYANPNNLDTSDESAEEALKAALAAWGSQSNANFRFVYGGRVNDTTTGYDNRNVTIFRNTTNGGAIAATYSWWSGNTLVDSDVIFYDGFAPMFGAYDTCTGSGTYIQDVATHEYGHALGLEHSSDPEATMYGAYYACTTSHRTLSADDIAGVEYLYPPSSRVSNTAPTVSISSPGNGSSFVVGTPVNFSGTATDTQDGNLSGSLTWTSSLSGYLSSGSGFTGSLPVGTHLVTASVTDSGGLSSSAKISVTITAEAVSPSPSGATLTVRAYKVKGQRRADLTWTNLTGTVNATRNGSTVYSGDSTGFFRDAISGKGAGTFTYRVCDSSQVCTNTVSVSF